MAPNSSFSLYLILVECSPRCFEVGGYAKEKETTKQHIFMVRIGVWDAFASIFPYKPTSPPRRPCGVRALKSKLSYSSFLSHTSLFCVSLFFYGLDCFFFHKPALAEYIKIPRTKERKRECCRLSTKKKYRHCSCSCMAHPVYARLPCPINHGSLPSSLPPKEVLFVKSNGLDFLFVFCSFLSFFVIVLCKWH